MANREAIAADLNALVASSIDLWTRRNPLIGASRPGTRWTNEQLLFHMVFGYMVVLRLLVLVRVFGRLPDRISAQFARMLNATAIPFDASTTTGPAPLPASTTGGAWARNSTMSSTNCNAVWPASPTTASDAACTIRHGGTRSSMTT